MEFKLRLGKKQKDAKIRNRLDNGYKRVKVRGRKRWVKPAAKAAAPAAQA